MSESTVERKGDVVLIGPETFLVVGSKGKLLLNLNTLEVRTDADAFLSSTLNILKREINLAQIFRDIIYNKI